VRILISIFICFVCSSLVQAEAKLSDLWPEAVRSGRFDDLGARFQVDRRLVLIPGANWCMVEGEIKRLMTPAWPSGKDWLLPNELVRWIQNKGWAMKQVAPVKSSFNGNPIIVLDAGHGGKDPGAIGLAGTREKDVVLDVTMRLKQMLIRKGIVVKTTRETDVFVDLHHRCDMSNQWKASVFVSIHCNSNNSRGLHGYQMLRQSESVTVHSRADFVKGKFPLPEYMPTPIGPSAPNIRNHVDLYRWKDRESMKLSERLHQIFSYRKGNVTKQKSQNLCVLRETMAPSILVEMDFISNPSVEVQMGASSWREKAAKDIFEGIMEYLGRGRQS